MSLSLCICSKKWLLTLGSWVTSYKGTYPGKIDSLGYHTPVWLTRSQEYDNLRRLIHREEIIRKCWPFDSSRFHLLLRKTHQGITPWGDRFNGESYPVESGLVRIFLPSLTASLFSNISSECALTSLPLRINLTRLLCIFFAMSSVIRCPIWRDILSL